MKKQNKNKIKRSTTRLVALGFALIIMIGTMLLSLPISVHSGQPNIMNALFTATSATCVTGLIVADTYQNWTTFGIIVIFHVDSDRRTGIYDDRCLYLYYPEEEDRLKTA